MLGVVGKGRTSSPGKKRISTLFENQQNFSDPRKQTSFIDGFCLISSSWIA